MNQKTPIEMERAKTIRILRTLTRLKYSLEADRELNELLPEVMVEFDQGVQKGELRTPTLNLLRDIVES